MRYPRTEQPLSEFLVVVFVLEHPAPKDGLFGACFWRDLDAVLERLLAFADEGLGGVETAFHGLIELLAVH